MKVNQEKKNKLATIGIFLLLIVGFLVLLYPWISDTYNTWKHNKLMIAYSQKSKEIKNVEKEKMLKEARQYNRTLVGYEVPLIFALKEESGDIIYNKLLNFDYDGVMATVEIPKIKTKLPIYHNTTKEVLLKGAGHICGSSLPVGGKSTHAVISAHRGLPSAKMFTDLDMVKKGDHIYIDVLDKKLAYKVHHIDVVEPDDARSLAIQKDKDYVSLVTCTPYGINTKRLIITGHRVPYKADTYKNEGSNTHIKWENIVSKVACIMIGILIAYLLIRIVNKSKNKKEVSFEKVKDKK